MTTEQITLGILAVLALVTVLASLYWLWKAVK